MGQKIDVILRSVLVQLCSLTYIPRTIQDLFSFCNQSYPPKIPTNHELIDSIRAILKDVSSQKSMKTSSINDENSKGSDVHVLIDGLDELPWNARQEFLQILNSLALADLKHLHLLVTSRTQPDIQEAMTKPLYWNRVTIDEGMLQTDIQLYVNHAIETSRMRLLLPSTKDAIRRRLVDQGKGM